VTDVNRNTVFAVGALAGAAVAAVLGRRRPRARPSVATPADARAQELREKLAEARQASVDEAEFEAAGMGAETIVAEDARPGEPPPANEFEAMRRRVHEEARAAADEMRRQAESPD
jgi:membrane-bound lytic murein transglycosylase B